MFMIMEKNNMDKKKILALMYDFYNEHVLKGQNDDIEYYINQIKKYNVRKVLVIGAGTGRVAIPISKYATVTAIDFDQARLEVLKEKNNNIDTICIDFLNFNSNEDFDLIIVPYSTLQFDMNEEKLNLFFKNLRNTMNSNTILIFDVSESFKSKQEKKKEFLFTDYCYEVDDNVEVYYTSVKFKKYIEFFIEYKLKNRKISVMENEKYYYYDRELLQKLITNNNFNLIKIDNGYGKGEFFHKHLYHCKKKI